MMLSSKASIDTEIIFLAPVFKAVLWGGDKLGTDWGYDVPGNNIGECWAVSAHPSGDGAIITKKYKGYTLSRLWDEKPELFGNKGEDGKLINDRFPLLTKIIDAKDDLSIQVHPDDAYAKVNENGSLGKTECWYILDAPEGATIVVGHNAKSREELSDMINKGRWGELIREIPVKKGDFVQINPGTVHAIKGGLQILETQQNSDITYRVYDYDRLTNGQPRELHVKQSIDVIEVPAPSAEDSVKHVQEVTVNTANELISCDYYTVWKLQIDGSFSADFNKPFVLMSVIEGEGSIKDANDNDIPLKKGDHFLLPYKYGAVTIEGNITIIASSL